MARAAVRIGRVRQARERTLEVGVARARPTFRMDPVLAITRDERGHAGLFETCISVVARLGIRVLFYSAVARELGPERGGAQEQRGGGDQSVCHVSRGRRPTPLLSRRRSPRKYTPSRLRYPRSRMLRICLSLCHGQGPKQDACVYRLPFYVAYRVFYCLGMRRCHWSC